MADKEHGLRARAADANLGYVLYVRSLRLITVARRLCMVILA